MSLFMSNLWFIQISLLNDYVSFMFSIYLNFKILLVRIGSWCGDPCSLGQSLKFGGMPQDDASPFLLWQS